MDKQSNTETEQGKTPAARGGRRARRGSRAARALALICLLIALSGVALAAVLWTSLARTREELAQLRQTMEASSSQEDPPPADSSQSQEETDPPEEDPPEEDPPEDPGPERPAYQDLYPELYAQPHDWNIVDEERTAYLTFDDGPSARTPEVLAVLERYGVKGTFFVMGKDTEQTRQWMRDIVAGGHTLGIHSYTHNYEQIYSSVEAFLDDFAKEYHLIEDATGVAPQVFRFPGGSVNAYNGHIYQEIVSEMTRRGFVYYDWNRMTGDAVRNTPAASVLAKNALTDIEGVHRIILLAHDSKRYTNMVESLPAIIEGYQAAGFTLKALTPEVKPIIYAYPNPK